MPPVFVFGRMSHVPGVLYSLSGVISVGSVGTSFADSVPRPLRSSTVTVFSALEWSSDHVPFCTLKVTVFVPSLVQRP